MKRIGLSLGYMLNKRMLILACIVLGINQISAQTIEDAFDLNFQNMLYNTTIKDSLCSESQTYVSWRLINGFRKKNVF
ncbi:hypothetical protein FACS1894160_3120 [Bacteroidia bacterium]|nr:hypothetical protein FACS1894123_05430 [Bacteroidia bacterium]GHV08584.1 hypothetical protein FACS1894160_3120 [Bacteroidia bacterium]